MKNLAISLAVLAATLVMTGCATAGAVLSVQGALAAAGFSLDAYCKMTPEGRAHIRAEAGIDVQLIRCPGDPAP